jgi:diguanylate cyclase (GGDEF)-like protein
MSTQLGRRVGPHVAILDYFMSVERLLDTPMLIETHDLRQTEKLAMLDGLTGVFNRRYMDLSLRKELNRCVRYQKELGLILMDLDNFKRFNDERGHVFGDTALKELARFLRECVREEDLVCRYGGEEFLVILPETSATGAFRLAERMRADAKARPFFRDSGITFSAGIAAYPEAGLTAQELVQAADKALYQAKFSGKDKVVRASPERRRHSRFPQSWSIDILERVPSRVELPRYPDAPRSIVTENVSVGGAKFECSERYDIDDSLSLHIRPLDQAVGDMAATGRVTWIQRKNQSTFAYGLSFVDLPSEAAKRFSAALAADAAKRSESVL